MKFLRILWTKIDRYALPLACAAAFSAAWQVQEWRHSAALVKQEVKYRTECTEKQRKSQEASYGYQKNLAALNSRVAELSLHKTCMPISSSSSGHNAAPGALDTREDGIAASTLFTLAGDAEKYRLQLIACQQWIRTVQP